MSIQGVFFDLGGTLFRYSGALGSAGLKYLLEHTGIRAGEDQIRTVWRDSSAEVGARYNAIPYFLHKDLFRDTVAAFLAHFGHNFEAGLYEAFHARQLEGMLAHLPIREDTVDTLQQLKARGLYTSIVSNIDDDYLHAMVEQHNLDALLDHWTSSEEARSCKPDPDIFHYCLNKAGLAREEVLFVGDSLHHDVAGAHRAGLRSAHIHEPGTVTPLTHGLDGDAEPTFQITTLSELIGIVDAANSG